MKFRQNFSSGPKSQQQPPVAAANSDSGHLSASDSSESPVLSALTGRMGSGSGSSYATTTTPISGLQTRQSRLKQAAVLALFAIGLTVCVSSLVCILLLPQFVTNQIAKRLVLKNNSLLLERWSKPNVPMFFKVWLFDVKNAPEILSSRGTKPKLQEIGPFVFRLKRQKDVVSFAGDNLYYTERKIYHFDRELSCCAINTTVTIPNIPLVAVVDRALGYNLPLVGRFIPRLINRAIQSLREQLFVRKQVREILFDGYEVELLRMVSRVGSLVGLPQTQQRFALLKGRNDSWRPEQDGVFAINTGATDRRKFGKVSSWNSYKQLPFWSQGSGCNTINGSDGTLFPPPIRREEPLYIFNAELCRTVNLIYQQPSEVRSIQALRFVLNPMNFAHTMDHSPSSSSSPAAAAAAAADAAVGPRASSNLISRRSHKSSTNSRPKSAAAPGEQLNLSKRETREIQMRHVEAAQENNQMSADQGARLKNPFTCFCDRKSTQLNGLNVCEYDGLIDLSKCTKQAQVIFGSMPHFHLGDPRLARQVNGMEPNASRHTTYLDIEPNTGLVLGGKRRVQLNLLVKRNNEVEGFENINDMLIPLVWFEESAMIPEESAQKFRSLYTDRIRLVNLVLTTLFLASIGLLAIDARLILTLYNNSQLKWRLTSSSAAPTDNDDDDLDQDSNKNSKSLLANTLAKTKAPPPTTTATQLAAFDPARRLLVKVPFTDLPNGGDQPKKTNEITRMQTNGSGGAPLLMKAAPASGSPSPANNSDRRRESSVSYKSFAPSQDSAAATNEN